MAHFTVTTSVGGSEEVAVKIPRELEARIERLLGESTEKQEAVGRAITDCIKFGESGSDTLTIDEAKLEAALDALERPS